MKERVRGEEREIACYGRDGPFSLVVALGQRGEKNGPEGEGKAFRAWNIHETEGLDKRNTSLLRVPDIRRFFRRRRHGIKSRGSRSDKLISQKLIPVVSFFLLHKKSQ